jgi:hypothetical protein
MSDVWFRALTRAWVVTVVASAALLTAVAIEQIWNSAVYWRGLPQAFELIGDEGLRPINDRWNRAAAVHRHAGLHPVAVAPRF